MDRADQFIDRIDTMIAARAAPPEMGRARDELASGARGLPVSPDVIFDDTLNTGIAIVRMVHCTRDLGGRFAD